MPAKTQICRVGAAGSIRHFKASKVLYTEDNAGITGVTPLGTGVKNLPLVDTAELMRVGDIMRIGVRCRLGTDRVVTYGLFVTPDKLVDALATFNGASPGTLNGNQILSANIVRRRVMR